MGCSTACAMEYGSQGNTMMQCVKYAIAWAFGVLYASSIWWLCVVPKEPQGASLLNVLSVLIVIAGSLFILGIAFYEILDHWNDNND